MGNAIPLTVLFVDHGEGLGGAEHSLLLLMRHLDRSRFRPVLACADGPLAQAAREASIDTMVTPIPRLRGNPTALLDLWRSARRLAELVRREDARVIHGNTMRASLPATLAAQLTRRPLVWHARDLFGPATIGGVWYPRLMGWLARVVIANSRAVARTIPRRDVRVIYNGVELDRFQPDRDPASARAALGLAATDVLIGMVGRMQPWKGHHLFLEAARRVSEQMPGARFVIVGGRVFLADAGYEDRLREQVNAIGLGDRVHFAGHQSNLAEWLAAMDAFAHCAQDEPFGRVIVEAMAAARPVVAFAGGGVPEIVIDGETGRLVAPGDANAMADAMLDVARLPALAAQMGQAGRRRAEAHFSIDAHARHIEAVYANIV